MKNRTKYLAGAALVLSLVLGGSAVMNSSEFLQGAFPGSGATWALSTSSPSGAVTVDAADLLFAFDVTAPATKDVKFPDGTHFDFTFASPTYDIDTFTPEGTRVVLRDEDGHILAYGYIATNSQGENPSGAWASVYFRNSTWSPVRTTVAAGDTMTFTLEVDTEALIDEDSSANELNVSMKYGTVSLTGNTLEY